MSTIAIITARGGSKRIPRKNIKNFMGKPMISYAIKASLDSKIFDEIMVSTEDEEIANISKECGAKVPFMRSQKNASDFATTIDVLYEVIDEYKKQGKTFDTLCCIYPCVPFLTSNILIDAYKNLKDNNAVLPVCKYSVPIEWAMKIEDNLLLPENQKLMNIRSQDLTPKYYDVGMFYFCKVQKMYEFNSLIPPKTTPYIIDEKNCQDIDTIEDWEMAEMKYKILNKIK